MSERGDAAARIARSCRKIGIKAFTLRHPGETEGVHLESSDEAIEVDDLLPETIVRVGAASGATALHPGFAPIERQRALEAAATAAGMTFVGPSAASLERLAEKLEETVETLGIRWSPRSSITSAQDAYAYADTYGYPLRLVDPYGNPSLLEDEDELEEASPRLTGELFSVQRWAHRPRLLRALIIGAGERYEAIADHESSLQASGQSLIEESPSPFLATHPEGDAIREAIFEISTRLARALEWRGLLGTTFLLDADNRLTLQAVAPGLPVHHAGIEMTTGLDLVELELLATLGEPLPEEVGQRQPSGHSIGAWIVAPTTEKFDEAATELRFPPFSQGRLRVEPSAVLGASVPKVDRPRIAKVTVCMAIRHQAHLVLDRVLAETRIAPYRTNIKLLRRVLGDESFRAGRYDAGFVTRLLTAPEARP